MESHRANMESAARTRTLPVDEVEQGETVFASLPDSGKENTNPMMPAGVSCTPAKGSRARKVFRVLLFPLQLLATPITAAVCAIVFASAGFSIGFIMGAQIWISSNYARRGLIPTIVLSVIALPSGILIGGTSSIAYLLKGLCAGVLMPWDGGKCAINLIQRAEKRIDNLYEIERHPREASSSHPLSSPASAAINKDEAIRPRAEGTLQE